MKKLSIFLLWAGVVFAFAQIPPSQNETKNYQGLFAAVAENNLEQVQQLIRAGANLEERDSHERTPLLVAAHFSHDEVAKVLLEAGADPNALDQQRYDLITIAAVNNDVEMIRAIFINFAQ